MASLTLRVPKGTPLTHEEGDANLTALNDELSTHGANTSNPHSVTATQVGLGNVDNTSDANKPVSTAQQAAIDAAVGGLAWNLRTTAVSTAVVDHDHLSVTAAGQTITFPASPTEGDQIRISLTQAATGTILSVATVSFYGAVTSSTIEVELVGVTLEFIFKDTFWRLI